MRVFLPGVAIVALGACLDGGTSDPPTADDVARDYDDLANVIGAHVRGEFALQLQAASIARGVFPDGFTPTGDGTGTGQDGAMTYDFVYHCNDGSPEHFVVPCDTAANHAHITITAVGSQSVGAMLMDRIDRVVDWEIRDLTLGKARFRGPDQVSLKTAVDDATYTVRFDATYEQVRYLPSFTIPTYGTIDFALHVARTRAGDHRVFDTTAHLVYGATGVPTQITFDGTAAYSIDLGSGAIVTNPGS